MPETKELATVAPEQRALAKGLSPEVLHKVICGGDLSGLNAKEQTEYYLAVCAAIGVNPATRPFEYIKLNQKLVLYARKDCTDQLRVKHGVSITSLTGEQKGDVLTVTAVGQNSKGRVDVATGRVSTKGLSGDTLAIAGMKAETKAKRRLTLSLCGLGMLDETELETIPNGETPADAAARLKAELEAPPEVVPETPPTPSADRQRLYDLIRAIAASRKATYDDVWAGAINAAGFLPACTIKNLVDGAVTDLLNMAEKVVAKEKIDPAPYLAGGPDHQELHG